MEKDLLRDARKLANYAEDIGIEFTHIKDEKPVYQHVGAMLADSILQAGVNYVTVVLPRVTRILEKYPSTELLVGVKDIVKQNCVNEYLVWQHPTKLERFIRLVVLLDGEGISDIDSLRKWLQQTSSNKKLLQLVGIGPKTCDYICGLAGLDYIAVDRHITNFVRQAGVEPNGYDQVKTVVSFAADLLDVSRREFDSWIWRLMSNSNSVPQQLNINL